MAKYLLRRFVFGLVTFLFITYLLYVLLCLVPGNPLMGKPAGADVEAPEAVVTLSIISKNWARWMGFAPGEDGVCSGLLQGNFGYTWLDDRPVMEAVQVPFLNTFFLNTAAAVLTLAITIPLGIACAVRYRSHTDRAVQTLSLLGSSFPLFLQCLLAIFVFAVVLRLFPAGGLQTPGTTRKGFLLMLDRLWHLGLPILCLTFSGLAGLTRTVRAAMVDALSMEYIRTARAKGLREKVVIYSHAWRNALLPVSTALGDWVIAIFAGGSLVVETSFALVGTGTLFWNALMSVDFEMVLFLQCVYVLALLLGRLLEDLLYSALDPRVSITK